MGRSKKTIWVYFISVILPLLPFIGLGAEDLKTKLHGQARGIIAYGQALGLTVEPKPASGTIIHSRESLWSSGARKEYAATAVSTGDLLNPDKWFEILKRNITIPISQDNVVNIPTPEESLRQSAPQLKEIGRGVKEETGIDLAKFIGWFAKVLKVFFQVVVNLLETVAKSFGQ